MKITMAALELDRNSQRAKENGLSAVLTPQRAERRQLAAEVA